jgi:hypothetical protein
MSPRERETLNALLAGADWLSEAREVEVPTRGEPANEEPTERRPDEIEEG